MAGSAGALAQLCIDTVAPTTTSPSFDFQAESLGMDEEYIDSNGVRGTRARGIDRVRPGLQKIMGGISFVPNVAEAQLLLAWALGTQSGSGPFTYPLADTLTSRNVQFDRVGKVFTYAGCYVDQVTLHAERGGALHVDLSVVGQTETITNAGTFSSTTAIDKTTTPWVFSDCTATIGGTTVTLNGINIVVNNAIDKDRFFNSLTLVSAIAQDRKVMFSTELPYGDYTAIYGTGLAASGLNGVAINAVFTNGVKILTLAMGKCVFPRKAPRVAGRREVMFGIEAQAFKATDNTLELVTTLAVA